MTQDELINIAIQAGFWNGLGVDGLDELNHFAELVAEKEREACAEVCKKHADVYAKLEGNPTAKSAWAACIDNRDAIRARGEA